MQLSVSSQVGNRRLAIAGGLTARICLAGGNISGAYEHVLTLVSVDDK